MHRLMRIVCAPLLMLRQDIRSPLARTVVVRLRDELLKIEDQFIQLAEQLREFRYVTHFMRLV